MFFKFLIYFSLICAFCFSLQAQERKTVICDKPSDEKAFKKWLEKDVLYIITKDEKESFLKLKTNEEKENFIKNFWLRRDPTPDTKENEFFDEYYNRIAYTNENFSSGIPGWRTDRGRTYIIWGKPSRIIKGYSTYEEFTNVLFEKWIYEHIDGTADIVEVTFVDPSETDEFRFLKSEKGRFLLTFTVYNNWILSKLDSPSKSKYEK